VVKTKIIISLIISQQNRLLHHKFYVDPVSPKFTLIRFGECLFFYFIKRK